MGYAFAFLSAIPVISEERTFWRKSLCYAAFLAYFLRVLFVRIIVIYFTAFSVRHCSLCSGGCPFRFCKLCLSPGVMSRQNIKACCVYSTFVDNAEQKRPGIYVF